MEFYDSEEEIAWGQPTLKEVKSTWGKSSTKKKVNKRHTNM